MRTGFKWKAKVAIQVVLANMPGGEKVNHFLQRRSGRVRPGYVDARLSALSACMETIKAHKPIRGGVVVEVGTGWDGMPTMLLSAEGAERVHTYDHVRHLRLDLFQTSAAQAVAHRPEWASVAPVIHAATLDNALDLARVSYTAPGDARMTGLPDGSADIFFSYGVLEHVPPGAAVALINEARRVLKPDDGLFYAQIGLHDHYNGFDPTVSRVNFLRYPDWLWNPLVQNSISYHNRLRERDFLNMLRSRGAEIVMVNSLVEPHDLEAVRTMKVAPRFRGYTLEELATTTSEIIARFPEEMAKAA